MGWFANRIKADPALCVLRVETASKLGHASHYVLETWEFHRMDIAGVVLS